MGGNVTQEELIQEGTKAPSGGGFLSPFSLVKSTGKLDKALAAAQAEFTLVPKTKVAKVKGQTKDGRSYEYEYKYADLADILRMALPILAKHGIAFNQVFRRKDGKLFLVTRLAHDGDVLEDDGLYVPEQTVKPSEFGGYATYAKRYGASAFLGIATEEDIDAPEESVKVEENGKPAPQKPSASEQPAPRRGRPAVKKDPTPVTKTETGPAPESAVVQVNDNGVAATDEDIPDNISSKPSPDDYKKNLDRLKKHMETTGKDPMKKFVAHIVGDENFTTSQLTTIQWNKILAALDEAATKGTLKDLK